MNNKKFLQNSQVFNGLSNNVTLYVKVTESRLCKMCLRDKSCFSPVILFSDSSNNYEKWDFIIF